MTTAHRPTWDPVKGGGTARDKGTTLQYSSRDLPSHKTLKHRQPGQGRSEDLIGQDLKANLEEREKRTKKKGKLTNEEFFGPEGHSKQPTLIFDPITLQVDADDEDIDTDENETEEEDDTEELLRQLEAIKKEKESEKQKKIAEEQREQEKIRREEFLLGNPLLNQSDDYSLKRKWTDDTVFKNCAKGISDKVEKRFINDTIRSDFHKKFMKKYVK